MLVRCHVEVLAVTLRNPSFNRGRLDGLALKFFCPSFFSRLALILPESLSTLVQIAVSRSTLIYCCLLCAMVSCSKQGLRVRPPGVDPAVAAKEAMTQYDANGDGKLGEGELTKTALSLQLWDSNRDGGITESEIVERLGHFIDSGVGLVAVTCHVSWNRSPLEGAKVVFEPEAFLGEDVQPSSGTTGPDGAAHMSMADEFLPRPNVKGIQPGLYKVRISHPQTELPDIYNTNTTLTYEYSPLDTLPSPRFHLSKQ